MRRIMKPELFRRAPATLALTPALVSLSWGAASAAGIGQTCGGIAGIRCDAPLWCDLRPGFCHAADVQGTCIRIPEFCTREHKPVCGCDNKTYGNDCDRRTAKVAKKHDGACQ